MSRQPPQDLDVSGLAHDLNNVLQTLVEAAAALVEDPRWAGVAATIQNCVERAKGITASLHSAGDAPAPFETILENAIRFARDWRGAGDAVEFVASVEPGLVLRRNWAWERVLINLFLNSLRAMPAGGAIQVRAGRDGDRIRVEVSDDGCGIADDILHQVFEPHVSGNDSSGLGLHIVAAIVRQEQGQVRAANRIPGPGAEFTILLPETAALPRASGAVR